MKRDEKKNWNTRQPSNFFLVKAYGKEEKKSGHQNKNFISFQVWAVHGIFLFTFRNIFAFFYFFSPPTLKINIFLHQWTVCVIKETWSEQFPSLSGKKKDFRAKHSRANSRVGGGFLCINENFVIVKTFFSRARKLFHHDG